MARPNGSVPSKRLPAATTTTALDGNVTDTPVKRPHQKKLQPSPDENLDPDERTRKPSKKQAELGVFASNAITTDT